mmetsp:Transcript_3910/g.2896  ORF Transcript_3910/g.2896 Transcript_3910/m.2896 type:complete len:95 (-) Transcript_3910:284-568(-)
MELIPKEEPVVQPEPSPVSELRIAKKRGRKPKEVKLQWSVATMTEIFNELSRLSRQVSAEPPEEKKGPEEDASKFQQRAKIVVPQSYKVASLPE